MTDQFAYVSALLSFVVALAMTHLLAGIAAIIRAPVIRVSFVHAAWVGISLFACVDYWFSIWGLRATESWSLAYVLYLLILATFLYVACHLVMPKVRDGEALDLVAFNTSNGRKYLGAYFLYAGIAVVANLTISGLETAVLINLATLVLIGAAWWWRDARVQVVAVVLLTTLFAYYAITYIPAL